MCKIYFSKVFYKHQFHHCFLYFMHWFLYHDFSLENFLLTLPKKIFDEQFGIRKLRGSKFFLQEKGILRFSVEVFCPTVQKKLRRRTLLCFKKILVSKNFKYKRVGIMVLSNFFCPTGSKNFVRGPFCVSEIF